MAVCGKWPRSCRTSGKKPIDIICVISYIVGITYKDDRAVGLPKRGKYMADGYYSVMYEVPDFPGVLYAMDYGFKGQKRWACSETEREDMHWCLLQDPVPEHGYGALLKHFGLGRQDVSFTTIVRANPSPADLARIRRTKEQHYNLPRLELRNQRFGCLKKEEVADYFEAA